MNRLIFLLVVLSAALPAKHAMAASTEGAKPVSLTIDWPPIDPNKERSSIPFSIEFAAELRAARTLVDVQRLIGTKVKITERREGDHLNVSYHWYFPRPDGDDDYLLITAYMETNENISCSSVVSAFDEEDRAAMKKIIVVIERVLRSRDTVFVSNRQPSVLTPLSEEGYQHIRVLPVEYCRNGQAQTIGEAAAKVYDGLRGMNRTLQGCSTLFTCIGPCSESARSHHP